jgi:hypothetical protein
MLRAELMAHPLESAALSRRTPISDFGQHLVAVAQSAKRLARLLLILAKFSKDGKPIGLLQRSARKRSRRRVNFFMNKVRKMGLIDYERETW